MQHLRDALDELAEAGRLRQPDGGVARRRAVSAAERRGVPFIDASSNDYLGLAERPLTPVDGSAGAGASRLIHGGRDEHRELESRLAAWLGTPSALLFSSGYAANVGVVSALAGRGDVIISDALNHASIIDGCRLSRATVVPVPHLEAAAVEAALAAQGGAERRWVVVESYYSMDGDGPDIPALSTLCDRYGAHLIVDEAHALGTFGPGGRGRCAAVDVRPDVLVGTFGKSFGAQGAFAAGSAELTLFLWNRARSFVYSTATSPWLAAAVGQRLTDVIAADGAREELEGAGRRFRGKLRKHGLAIPAASFGPIVPVVLGTEARALAAADRLLDRGVLTQAIRPPTVPEGTARLRITLKASHDRAIVDELANHVVAACAF